MEKVASQKYTDLSQISTTGIRIIVLFSLLLDSPKSAEEINRSFFKHPLIRAQFSDDTIRNDINTLRNSGCNISRALKKNNNKYVMFEHPFLLDLKLIGVESLKKSYNKIYQNLGWAELVQLERLFEKLALYTNNPTINEKLKNISVLRFIDKQILKELLHHSYNNDQITLSYKSVSGNQKILELIIDDVAFRNDKLYVFGYDLQLKKSAFYLVRNVLNVLSVKIKSNISRENQIKVKYKLLNANSREYVLQKNEKIIEEAPEGLIIEAVCRNEFIMTQNLLRLSRNCIILEPLWFREKFIKYIKLIREVYNAD